MTNSREKGADYERHIANRLKEYGYDARRGQQYSGANGDADVVGVHGLHIECKADERLNIFKAMEQSRKDARDWEIPIVAHKKNYKPDLITLDFDNFFEIWTALEQFLKERDGEERLDKTEQADN